ncbi:hypothetical protein FMM68_12235 [Lachnospiraceae bacterium MD329]|nr:hypothetical protein [Lachnospiraceae bacterium MD329]
MCDMIIHSEYENLLEETKKLQAELSTLIMERDELKHHICKNIQTEYILKLGTLEYKVFEFQCKILRIKRKIEIIQAHFNRQEIVNIIEIEVKLDFEYSEYQKKLDEKMNDINEALERNSMNTLTPEETEELKKTYKQIVKKLHPDINPNVTEGELKLFNQAVEAYKSGDIQIIRSIAVMISEISVHEEIADSMKVLKEKIDKLKQMIADVLKEIEQIKQSFPYNQKELLSNSEKVKECQDELNVLLDEYRKIYAIYEQKLNDMLGGLDNG